MATAAAGAARVLAVASTSGAPKRAAGARSIPAHPGPQQQQQHQAPAALQLLRPAGPLATAGALAASLVAGVGPALAELVEDAAADAADAAELADFTDPSLTVGIATVVGVPLAALALVGLFSAVTSKVKRVSASTAFELLANVPKSVLIDIRQKSDVKDSGTVDLRSMGKRPISIAFETTAPDGSVLPNEQFADQVAALELEPETVIVLLDGYGQQAPTAAAQLADKLGFAVSVVAGGADGGGGWKASDIPWRTPPKGFTLDLAAFPELVGKLTSPANSKQVATAAVAAGAVAVGTVVLFQELETVLEVIGIAGLLQLLSKRLLFATDRERTVAEIKAFVDKKIAPREAGKQFQQLAATLVSDEDDERITAKVVEAAAKASKGAPGSASLALPASRTLVDVASSNPTFSVLVEAIARAGLADALAGPGPFTVFAPTDAAFGAALRALKASKEELLARPDLADILKYHVVPGRVASKDLSDGMSAATLLGKPLTFSLGAGVKVNGAKVVAADVASANGVLHVIDAVMLPPA